ncbi:hypothetical protein SAMN04487898_10882 [Pedobacter sp. ok626]|nr:hypothetical protein SAMN04487898_10882 [Pedobacter sp. ok626]
MYSFVLFSNSSFGQYAETVRKAVTTMLKAKEQNDYYAYVDNFYPSDIKMRRGKAAFIKQLRSMKKKQK